MIILREQPKVFSFSSTLDPSVVHAVGATKADAINMLKNTDDTAGEVAGSFDLKQLVVQDEGFKSIHINLGGGQAEWLLIANAAETEVTAIRGAGGGGTPENYVIPQSLVTKTFKIGDDKFDQLLAGSKNGRNFAANRPDQLIDPIYMEVVTLEEGRAILTAENAPGVENLSLDLNASEALTSSDGSFSVAGALVDGGQFRACRAC